MIQLIVGNKGKGKTKHLLDKVNAEVLTANGNIVYLDKSTKHMFELNNKVRLIDVNDFLIENCDQFVGFVLGIISQDHDLEQVYFDGFMDIAKLDANDVLKALEKFEVLGEKYNIKFVISISMDEKDIPESMKSNIIVSL